MVVRDKVVRLSTEVIDKLQERNENIELAIRNLLGETPVVLNKDDVVTKRYINEALELLKVEIFDKINKVSGNT